jgi:hypothetical protein
MTGSVPKAIFLIVLEGAACNSLKGVDEAFMVCRPDGRGVSLGRGRVVC